MAADPFTIDGEAEGAELHREFMATLSAFCDGMERCLDRIRVVETATGMREVAARDLLARSLRTWASNVPETIATQLDEGP